MGHATPTLCLIKSIHQVLAALLDFIKISVVNMGTRVHHETALFLHATSLSHKHPLC